MQTLRPHPTPAESESAFTLQENHALNLIVSNQLTNLRATPWAAVLLKQRPLVRNILFSGCRVLISISACGRHLSSLASTAGLLFLPPVCSPSVPRDRPPLPARMHTHPHMHMLTLPTCSRAALAYTLHVDVYTHACTFKHMLAYPLEHAETHMHTCVHTYTLVSTHRTLFSISGTS